MSVSKQSIILFIFAILFCFNAENTILKVPDDNPITIKASTSHQFIPNTNGKSSKVAVLFDISTSSIKPVSDQTTRDPYELAVVLDRSGSMAGDKIEKSKTAIMSIVDNMIEGDIIHIIQYDDNVQTLIRNGKKSDQREIFETIKTIQVRGSTNLFGGLSKAYDILKENNANKDFKTSHSRIFLFSDGLLNAGITDKQRILNSISSWKNELDLTISTFGIGYDFDRNIMTAIAEQSNGDFFFIDSSDSIAKVIEIARKDAESIVGTEAVLSFKTGNYSNIDIKLNNLFSREKYNLNAHKNYNEIQINDLRSGGSKYVLIELLVEPKDIAVNEVRKDLNINILEWELRFNGKGDIFVDSKQSISGNVDIQITDEKNEILEKSDNIDNEVMALWEMNEMTRLDREIMNDINSGNYNDAQRKKEMQYKKINNPDSMYSNYMASSGNTKLGQTMGNMNRRMRAHSGMDYSTLKNMIPQKKKKILFDLQSNVELNEDADYDHQEL